MAFPKKEMPFYSHKTVYIIFLHQTTLSKTQLLLKQILYKE